MNDRGLYSCNLHHLYCHLYEMVRVQLNVTKSRMYHTVPNINIFHTYVLALADSVCLFCACTIKAVKNSASGTDKRRCMWCCLAELWCCRASIDVMCGQTGATRRRTSRCVQCTSVFVGPLQTVSVKSRFTFNWLRLTEKMKLPSLPWWLPGGPLGPSVPRGPPRPRWPAGGPVRLRGAAQLRATVPPEEDEHQQPSLHRRRFFTRHIWSAGVGKESNLAESLMILVHVVKIYCYGKSYASYWGHSYSKGVPPCTLDSVYKRVYGCVCTCLQCFQNTWVFH